MYYKYCSICGSELRERKDGNLACPKCDFVNYRNPRPTVTAIVLYGNKLLLTKRAREPFKDWWDFPGGFMHNGESPKEAIAREVKEETGLDIAINKLFGIYPGTYPSDTEPFHILSVVYIAKSNQEELEALDDVAESVWFEKKAIPEKIAFDSNQQVLKDFLKIWK